MCRACFGAEVGVVCRVWGRCVQSVVVVRRIVVVCVFLCVYEIFLVSFRGTYCYNPNRL